MFGKITNRFPQEILYVYDLLCKKEENTYFVGGCVRDSFLGHTTSDFDITSALLPEEIFSALSAAKLSPFMKNERFGTVSVNVACGKESCSVEITPFRRDGEYRDFRHPESVAFSKSIHEDLARRDFTVNALAVSKSEFADDFGGLQDLENKNLRCVGDAKKRFSEDALRILRALRFCATLGFAPEEETEKAIELCTPLMESISRERILCELEKTLLGEHAQTVLQRYVPTFSYILGNYCANEFFQKLPQDFILRLFSLVCNRNISEFCTRFPFSSAQKTRLLHLDTAFRESRAGIDENMGEREIKLLIKYGADTMTDIFRLLGKSTHGLSRFVSEKPHTPIALDISGGDLKDAGFCGAQISSALNILLEKAALSQIKNEKSTLLRYAMEKLK